MSRQKQHLWVKRDSLIWLLVAQAFAIFPLFIYLPLWIPVFWIFSAVWRVQIYRGAWPFPSNKIKFFLGTAAILGLFISYAGSVGVEPLVGFLLISFILKLLEVRTKNDYLLIIYVGFITVAAQFLFFQTMFVAIYGCISAILLICAWNTNYRSHDVSAKKQIFSSGILFLQSLPLMLVLFIVLPRVGTLWHVPIPQKTGVTGFSNTMSPGDFSSLSQSREVAFRVSFDKGQDLNILPVKSQWYWRGLVLDEFDGRSWTQKDRLIFSRPYQNDVPKSWGLSVVDENDTLRYSILMEPHQQEWLFTLMAPVFIDSSSLNVFFVDKYSAKSKIPVSSRTQYHVISNLSYIASPEALSKTIRRHNLRLPANFNPKTLALVEDWQKRGLEGRALVDEALSYYRSSFTYTLRPPTLGLHSVDEFLFDSQRGFCEHFASSFVVMMRAAGIPARVVLGYQGGEFNPIENYIIVRQSNAHAWTEVWFEGEGWVRVDPTAAVSPSRIEQGLEESLGLDDRELVTGFFKGDIFAAMQLQIDALSFTWHRWVLSYDTDSQASLFKKLLGGAEGWRVAFFFVGFVSAVLLLYYLWFTLKGRVEHDYLEQEVFSQFLKTLKKAGYSPRKGETENQFSRRVSENRPEWSSQITSIATLYSEIAYSENRDLIPNLRLQIADFKKQIKSGYKK